MKIYGTMCMMPGRYPESLKTVDSLEGQVDRLYLSLNGFDFVPEELKKDWIEILHVGKNLGDASRFYLLRFTGDIDSHVISCDDDIVYPETYVSDFLEEHNKKPDSVLCHHGKILQVNHNEIFMKSMLAIRQENKEYHDGLHMPGSGAVFIPKDIFNKLEFTSLVHMNQADVHLAANFFKLGVNLIGVPHPHNYVGYFHPKDGYTIWDTVTSKPDWSKKAKRIFESYKISIE